MAKANSVLGGGVTDARKRNSVPSKRYGKPATDVVTMAEVPEPPPRKGGISDELYLQIGALKLGSALRVHFETEQHADYVRGKLRSKAKKDKQFMSSSRSADGKTRYFWLEKL